MSIITVNIYNYTGYKDIFVYVISDNEKNTYKLACATSNNAKLTITYSDSAEIYLITSDGKYIGKINGLNNFGINLTFSLYIDLKGQNYDCDGNVVMPDFPTKSPYFQLSLIQTSLTNFGNNVIVNGDGTITYNGKTYNVSDYKNSINISYTEFIIITILILIVIAVVVYFVIRTMK